jgi:predicted nucleotidyltransferase
MESSGSIVAIIKKHYPNVITVYQFGSHGTEYERADSDVDIAMLLPASERTSPAELIKSECRSELEESLEKSVDFVDIRSASTVFQKEIVTTGEKLWCANPFETELFELFVWSSYQKLNDERAAIIAQATQTGRFYGA